MSNDFRDVYPAYEMGYVSPTAIFGPPEEQDEADTRWEEFVTAVKNALPRGFNEVMELRKFGTRAYLVVGENEDHMVVVVHDPFTGVAVAVNEDSPSLPNAKDVLKAVADKVFETIGPAYRIGARLVWNPDKNNRLVISDLPNPPAKRDANGWELNSQGLRTAPGNKFGTVLDSFIYAVAREKPEESVSLNGAWCAVVFDGRAVFEDILDIAKKEAVEDDELGLNEHELMKLDATDGYVVIEDPSGFVEVWYYEDEGEAWTKFDEVLEDCGVDPDMYWKEVDAEEDGDVEDPFDAEELEGDLDISAYDEYEEFNIHEWEELPNGEMVRRRQNRPAIEDDEDDWTDEEWGAAAAFAHD
jgi:hypothetical protein